MTASSFIAWRSRLHLTAKAAAETLGCSRNAIARWEAGSVRIPRYIALACAAIAQGVPPIGEPTPIYPQGYRERERNGDV